MIALGQVPLFSVLPGGETDTVLAEMGYIALDETWLYSCAITDLAQRDLPPVTAFPIWPPLQLARDIWAEGGVGPDRVAVMERATCDRTAILGRINDRAGGVAYAGLHEGCVMVHALEILESQRRNGLAGSLMIAAAKRGAERGAQHMALRKVGFSDRDIWDIAATAGFYNMTNRMASAVDMRPNDEYHAAHR